MDMNTLKRKTPNKKAKIIGRGGDRGKTSGSGHKGQKARAGNSKRSAMRDIIKKIPKLRGHGINRSRTVVYKQNLLVINVAKLDEFFKDGDTVNPETLVAAKLAKNIRETRHGVKILGAGEITKKITVEACVVSASAKEKIEKAGGNIAE
ncbi:MAG: 50S ribosomal protein L15 [Candidatus Nomurabacteria bacterium]|nr:50S ribosomal protein L15 [Candidatus Nomurabacteria bacterium]